MNDFHSKLVHLKTAYHNTLPEKIAKLESLWRRYLEQPDTPSLDEFQQLVHGLAGSGSTFGYSAISQAARALQNRLKQWRGNGCSPHKDDYHHLQQLLDELLNHMRHTPDQHESDQPALATASAARAPFTGGRVLLAESKPDIRGRFILALEKMGHRIYPAHDAGSVLSILQQRKPELIFLGAGLPGAPLHELMTRVRAQVGNDVPVILLADQDDICQLEHCLDTQCNDFLPRNASPCLLDAKIRMFRNIARVQRELEHYRERTEEEMKLAQQVFQSVLQQNQSQLPLELEEWNLAASHFSGDILLHACCPDGSLNLFLGDFTGHGLPAAVGTLIAAGIVQGMSRKNMAPEKILAELNRKLSTVLPVERYCAGIFVRLDPSRQHVQLWNCGLPEALLISSAGEIVQSFPSHQLPLGITAVQELGEGERIEVDGPASLLLMSDGVTEALDPQGRLFGSERLLQVIENSQDDDKLFEAIRQAVLAHMGERPPADDISLMRIKLGVCQLPQ